MAHKKTRSEVLLGRLEAVRRYQEQLHEARLMLHAATYGHGPYVGFSDEDIAKRHKTVSVRSLRASRVECELYDALKKENPVSRYVSSGGMWSRLVKATGFLAYTDLINAQANTVERLAVRVTALEKMHEGEPA